MPARTDQPCPQSAAQLGSRTDESLACGRTRQVVDGYGATGAARPETVGRHSASEPSSSAGSRPPRRWPAHARRRGAGRPPERRFALLTSTQRPGGPIVVILRRVVLRPCKQSKALRQRPTDEAKSALGGRPIARHRRPIGAAPRPRTRSGRARPVGRGPPRRRRVAPPCRAAVSRRRVSAVAAPRSVGRPHTATARDGVPTTGRPVSSVGPMTSTVPALDLTADPVELTAALVDVASVSGDGARARGRGGARAAHAGPASGGAPHRATPCWPGPTSGGSSGSCSPGTWTPCRSRTTCRRAARAACSTAAGRRT